MFNLKSFSAAVGAAFIALTVAPTIAAAEETASVEKAAHYEGVWTKKTFKSAGSWSITEDENGDLYVNLSSDFKTRNGPDLKIFLSPQNAADTTGKNATNGAVMVAVLGSNKGAQSYKLPEGTNLDDFSSILIHCEAYSKLWSASDLS